MVVFSLIGGEIPPIYFGEKDADKTTTEDDD
jgi:hypothetical protein